MRLVTAEEMRLADHTAINDYGIPGAVLMENAGLAVIQEAEKMLDGLAGKKAAIFCGGGNNGGDGLVVARHLYNRGCEVRLYFLTDPDIFRGDALINWNILKNMGITGYWLTEGSRLNVARMALWSSDIAIDAIFGTGLNDMVSGTALSVINIINESKKPVISCDIPSGLSAQNGKPLGVSVKATVTVTFGFCKLGLVLPSAMPYVGQLVVADISLPMQIAESLGSRRELIDRDFCGRWLLPRHRDGYKNQYGHVLLLAGSAAMPGAAVLAARGALKTGAGLATAALPTACRASFSSQVPEAMLLNLNDSNSGNIALDEAKYFADFNADCYLIGPGMGRAKPVLDLIREIIPLLNKPTVLDADALFAVCGYLKLLKTAKAPIIITPHPGEMAKLLGITTDEVQANRISVASEFAKQTNVIVVLKGAGTIIATPEGRIFVNHTGNPGMATGGTGDVLSGMIAALLAQGMPPAAAAACAVWLHGRAGDLAAATGSEASLIANDVVHYLPQALAEVYG